MPIEVTDALFSFVRAVALPALARPSKAGSGPWVGRSDGHVAALRGADDATARWKWPWWAETSYSHFWKRHLGGKARYRSADPQDCWARAVPLWDSATPALVWSLPAPPGLAVSTGAERFLFPCGAAAVVTVRAQGALPLADLVGFAAQCVGGAAYRRVVGGVPAPAGAGPAPQPVQLRRALADLLFELQRDVLGAPDPDAIGDDDPLAVMTPISVTGDPTDAVLVAGNPVHQVLRGLCAFDAGVIGQPPAVPLAQSLLPVSGRSNGGVLFADRRSLATWSPRKMSGLDGGPGALSCYHRNLVLATAFVEALLSYVTFLSTPGRRDEVAKHAVTVLGRFYGGPKDIWTSSGVKHQIDASNQVEFVNQLRLDLAGLKPLAGRPAPPAPAPPAPAPPVAP